MAVFCFLSIASINVKERELTKLPSIKDKTGLFRRKWEIFVSNDSTTHRLSGFLTASGEIKWDSAHTLTSLHFGGQPQ